MYVEGTNICETIENTSLSKLLFIKLILTCEHWFSSGKNVLYVIELKEGPSPSSLDVNPKSMNNISVYYK